MTPFRRGRERKFAATSSALPLFSMERLRVDEGHQVDGVRVRRQRLVLPVGQRRPVDDLVERRFQAHGRLVHQIEVDDRHPPEKGVDATALEIMQREFFLR